MVVTQAATFAGIEPFATWNTPIAWTGFILFADGVVYRARGDSWIRSAPGEFALLAAVSIPLWIIFEGYNLVINNWYYSGLIESFWWRQFGFAWAFATIWPAIFEAAELVAVIRATAPTLVRRLAFSAPAAASLQRRAVRTLIPNQQSQIPAPARAVSGPLALPTPPALPAVSLITAIFMLASPFLVPGDIARYLAAPVWLGFILLLDPINRRLRAEVLTRERAVNLALGGVLCGLLWEFWNYWARAKWHYTVPIMEDVKLFEMPLPGYFGFPPFALECFTMYVFVRRAFTRLGRPIALLAPASVVPAWGPHTRS
jgi:hypothetical protein